MRGQSGTHLHYKPRYIYPETISHWIMHFYKSIAIKQNVWDISALSTFKEWWVDNILSIVWRPEVASSSCAAPLPPTHDWSHTYSTCDVSRGVTCHVSRGHGSCWPLHRVQIQNSIQFNHESPEKLPTTGECIVRIVAGGGHRPALAARLLC